ncbi:GDCCVxC domain-containing (seleno)protein [Methylocystis sp. JAN1]|uniref:GDCCVxC domain-containing (seleno)protein n=1 Tax=Methylocystis sp. JAN1 TaxID=3397211 RepID=UPI003FA2C2D0
MLFVSTLTCPRCGHRSTETMPTDACLFYFQCKGCGAVLRPKPSDCCVFCSYGDVPCPPTQEAGRENCSLARGAADAP